MIEVFSQRDQEERLRDSLVEMRAALDLYNQDFLQYPTSFEVMKVTKRLDGEGFYLRKFPINPMNGTQTWEIASRTTLPGTNDKWNTIVRISDQMSDVTPIVDIRCPANAGTGINGIPYKEW